MREGLKPDGTSKQNQLKNSGGQWLVPGRPSEDAPEMHIQHHQQKTAPNAFTIKLRKS